MSAPVARLASHARPLTQAGLGRLADDLAAGARVVGLGPTTREAAETSAVQATLLGALLDRGFDTLVVQDTTEIGERLDRWVGTPSDVGPAEDLDVILADAWGPWRVEPFREALHRIRGRNRAGVSIQVLGTSTPTAVPADYDRVLALTAGHIRLRELLTTIRVAHDGGEHVERAHGRWDGPPFVDLAREARALTASLDLRDRAEAVAVLDRIVHFHAGSLSQGHDPLAEDVATADRLTEHLTATGRRAVIWDGIAHLRASGRTFGGRLHEHWGSGYRCVVTTFGSGRIRDVHIPPPRPDAWETTLDAVAATVGGAHVLDLTGPLPTEVQRWRAATAPIRLISGMYDPAEDERHYLVIEALGASVDAIVHLPTVTPVQGLG